MTAGASVEVVCPYCYERQEIWIDIDVDGAMVQDCEVCCQPWQMRVIHDEDGAPDVYLERAQ